MSKDNFYQKYGRLGLFALIASFVLVGCGGNTHGPTEFAVKNDRFSDRFRNGNRAFDQEERVARQEDQQLENERKRQDRQSHDAFDDINGNSFDDGSDGLDNLNERDRRSSGFNYGSFGESGGAFNATTLAAMFLPALASTAALGAKALGGWLGGDKQKGDQAQTSLPTPPREDSNRQVDESFAGLIREAEVQEAPKPKPEEAPVETTKTHALTNRELEDIQEQSQVVYITMDDPNKKPEDCQLVSGSMSGVSSNAQTLNQILSGVKGVQ